VRRCDIGAYENRCGDGMLDAEEECDGANRDDEDGCASDCGAGLCGDGIRQADLGEECDDGNDVAEDGSAVCLSEFCGDGIEQAGLGEECDDGNESDGDGCSAPCRAESCGDAVLQPGLGELYDDGNNDDGDCCSSAGGVRVTRRKRGWEDLDRRARPRGAARAAGLSRLLLTSAGDGARSAVSRSGRHRVGGFGERPQRRAQQHEVLEQELPG
jgi:cysteine-rich repeat protein